ncbi:MAG: gluconolaconase [Burkholderiales bacterium]|nr:gluconolaconase [Burkholderiales bacterium]
MSFFSRRPVLSLALGLTAIAAVTTTVFYPWNGDAPKVAIPFVKKPLATNMQWEAQIAPFMDAFALTSASAPAQPEQAEQAEQADQFSDPFGIAIDKNGNIFVADAGEHNRILKINPQGEVSVVAGGAEGYLDSSAKQKEARFHTPSGIALDPHGNLYVADTGNHVIRKINPQGVVSTFAGNGQAGFRDGAAGQAQLNGPIGVAVDRQGRVWVADTYNDKIRMITVDGMVHTVAGGDHPGYQDGLGSAALFDTPSQIVINSLGEAIVTDTRNNAVRKISERGEVSTLMRSEPDDHDALLRRPVGLAITHDDHLYVSELSHGRLLQIAPNGESRGVTGVDIDIIPGDDTSPRLQNPVGIAVDQRGNLLISDNAKNRVHLIRSHMQHDAAPVAPRALAKPAIKPLQLPWPLLPQDQPHEVVGTIGEVRGNYDGESRDHFHRGLDVQAAMGDTVVVIKDEKIKSPVPSWAATSINEGMRINALSYIHMKVGRTAKESNLDPQKFQLIKDSSGKLQQVRIRRGTRFHTGEPIGSINSLYHVHLNYAPEGDVINPLTLGFPGFQDSVAPHVEQIQIANRDGDILPLPIQMQVQKKSAKKKPTPEPKADGLLHLPRTLEQVSIIVDAYDQADGNLARRRLGVYEIAYQILDAQGQPLPGFEQAKLSQRFDRLPTDEEAVKIAYAPLSGVTAHGNARTRFLHNISNEIHDGHALLNYWNIKELPAGEYLIRVFVKDFAGNLATGRRELRVRIE